MEGTNLVATARSDPFSVKTAGFPEGLHVLKAVAYDELGAFKESNAVKIRIVKRK